MVAVAKLQCKAALLQLEAVVTCVYKLATAQMGPLLVECYCKLDVHGRERVAIYVVLLVVDSVVVEM